MMSVDLREFIEGVIDRQYISAKDVEMLRQDILSNGVGSRREAEALLALDRTVEADPSWGPALSALIVAFVVESRQTSGAADHDDALWLATSLEVGNPSGNALAIAYAILDHSPQIGPALLDFIMRARQQQRVQNIAA